MHCPEPRAILAVVVPVGETTVHARDLTRINDLVLLRLRMGRLEGYLTVAEARAIRPPLPSRRSLQPG